MVPYWPSSANSLSLRVDFHFGLLGRQGRARLKASKIPLRAFESRQRPRDPRWVAEGGEGAEGPFSSGTAAPTPSRFARRPPPNSLCARTGEERWVCGALRPLCCDPQWVVRGCATRVYMHPMEASAPIIIYSCFHAT